MTCVISYLCQKAQKDANRDEIAIASDDGNILVYSASQIGSTKPIVLKFKEEINGIITLGWGPVPNLDVIGIGSSESIQVYNAFENVSIFYKKIDDGIRYVIKYSNVQHRYLIGWHKNEMNF